MAKYDDMSFGKAFAAARGDLGSGKTFTWKGKTYKTDTADGKKAEPKGGMTSSPKPAARPSWMSTPGGQVRMGAMTPEGKRSDASRVSSNPPPKPAAGATLNSSPRPQPKPAAMGMTTSPRPQPKSAAKPASGGMTTSPRPQPKPMAKPAAKPAAQPQRPVSKTPGAKPAGEGKKLTYESRAFIARNTKGK